MATTITIVGAGTYQNVSRTSGAWQPPVCNYVTLTLQQVNTEGPGQTANLSGSMLSSQDGVHWTDSGDFSADFGWVDITKLNKNGVHPIPPDAIFGTPYAPFLKIQFTLAGKVTIADIILSTN
jgi:hypothetical protein